MAAIYEIVVESELGARCAAAFEGMRLEHLGGRTAIVGPVEDQAHLAGLLNRVSDLGLTLVSVEKLEKGDLTENVR
jgi:outer membrane PBP1 activator LpoA protein